MSPLGALRRKLRADEVENDDRGWTANLAVFRIVFCFGVALPMAVETYRWTAHVMPGFPADAWVPVSFFRLIPPGVLADAALAQTLAVLDIALIVLAGLGVFTRGTLALATVLSLFVLGLTQNQGHVTHFHHLVWFMALLAVGPSGHALSLDAVVRAIRGADRAQIAPLAPPGAALTTLRYVWVLMGLLYLVPGIAKLEQALMGGWLEAENLRLILWRKWFELELYAPGYRMPIPADVLPDGLLMLGGLAAIAFELSALPLILFRRTRPVVALAGVLFHLLNGAILGIGFEHLLVSYVCLVDWSATGRAGQRRLVGPPLLVFYDAGCRLCRRAIAVLRVLDPLDAMEPVPGPSDDPRRRRYPELTDAALLHDLHAAAGSRTAAGFDAYRWIAARLLLLWPAALLMRLPPIARFGRRIYRRVADTRACAIEPSVAAAETRPAAHAVHRVGAALVLAQSIVSAVLFADALADTYLERDHLARQILAAIAWRRPNWPFDQYPLFSRPAPASVEIWEARLVMADGRESRVPAAAYAAGIGGPPVCWKTLTRALEQRDAERHAALSRSLATALWRSAGASRTGAVELRIYRARYRLSPPQWPLVDERLLYRLSAPALRADRFGANLPR